MLRLKPGAQDRHLKELSYFRQSWAIHDFPSCTNPGRHTEHPPSDYRYVWQLAGTHLKFWKMKPGGHVLVWHIPLGFSEKPGWQVLHERSSLNVLQF